MWTFLIAVLFVVSSKCQETPVLVIGGIIYQDAINMKNALELSTSIHGFGYEIAEVSNRGEILEITQKVCELAEKGVVGIIDGTSGRASEHIQSLCDMLELPHIIIQHNDFQNNNWSMLNMHLSADAYNGILTNLINVKDWNNFTILYVQGHSLTRISDLLKMGNDTDLNTVSVRELSGDDYRDVLIDAKENGYTNFVVDCPSRKLEQLLIHAQQVGLMADEHSYIFLSPDLFTLDLKDFRYGGVNITGFRMVDLVWNEKLWDFTAQYTNYSGIEMAAEQMETDVLLIHDSILVFAEAIKKVNITVKKVQSLKCDKYESWTYGTSLLNFMKTNQVQGLTKTIIFDGMGQRTDVMLDILELTPSGNQTIGEWTHNQLNMSRPFVPTAALGEESLMRNKTFKVLIAITPPYGYRKESAKKLEGNDRYEGFTIDLIILLAEMLGFNYEFEIEPEYGTLDKKTMKWNGMVRKLREEEADFGICDFTITAERQSGIDFSTPFMTLGIGIIYKEPSKQPPEMFSFMDVFAKEVWYYMVLVQLGLGCIMIFVGRISHKEWQNPVPCVESPDELSNQFSFANSVWLIIGAVLQQGSEIAPIALAPRLIASVWWFFTMVMVASYTGTLVAFLTVEKNVLPFKTVQELYNHKSISYGAKSKGSTLKFFEESQNEIYQAMYKNMKSKGWLVPDNDYGIGMVENTTYAFFMESTSIEYYKEQHCDLIQIGDLLDSKSYGIGMKKDSKYKKEIDDALLKLKEKGEIRKLKDIWWKEKRGGGKCQVEQNEEPKQLDMKNLIGAFVVLGFGCIMGLGISLLDMLWGVFKRTMKYNTTFKFELIEELKFVIQFSGDVKPVRRVQKSDEGSSQALADAEEKDEVRSLKSLGSGKSTDTHRTSHSHSSRHSSGGQIAAFARRREYT